MTILKNYSLKPYNTFGIDAHARFFAEVTSLAELMKLRETFEFNNFPRLVLGGGSNMLLSGDFPGLVIKNSITGMEVVEDNNEYALLKSFGGTVWHDVVLYTVTRGWGGIENLSLIPGSVGAAPMQNIGAYGVELKETFVELEALELETGEMKKFTNEECKFGYRDSIFKNEAKGKYFIVSVTLKLLKHPVLRTDYGDIARILSEKGIKEPSVKDVSDAVISIRQSKLPDPKDIGNAGSFFKNPEVSQEAYDELAKKFADIPHYPGQKGGIKLSGAFMIEQCGWKGKKVGNTGSHTRQALVLVNYGGATGNEVQNLAAEIIKSVHDKFGVTLTSEVNII